MRKSRKLLLIWLIVFIGLGVLMESMRLAIGSQSQFEITTDLVVGIAFSFVIFAWCRAESLERGFEGSRWSRALAAIIPPVGLPLYLIRNRGLRNGTIMCLKAIGCFVGFSFAFGIAEVVRSFVYG